MAAGVLDPFVAKAPAVDLPVYVFLQKYAKFGTMVTNF